MKDPDVFLRHILESIEWIERYTNGVSENDFLESVQLQDAAVRRIEIIGEATKNIPEEFKTLHPNIPWKKIVGMRDMLIHEYFSVDEQLLWETIQKDVPTFKTQVQQLLSKET